MKNDVFPAQQWFWGILFEQAGAGQKMGNTYSMSLILPWLFSFVFSAATSVKLAMFFSTLLFIVSFYYVARIYMADLYAFLCSLVALTPMFDIILSGMWYNYFSLGCGLLFWLSCHIFLYHRTRIAYIGAVISFALAVYSHPVGIIFSLAVHFSYMVAILFSREMPKYRLLIIYGSMPCAGLLLAFPQLQTILRLDAPPAYPIMETGREYPVTGIIETLRRLLFIRVWSVTSPPPWDVFLMAANIGATLVAGMIGLAFLFRGRELEMILPLASIFLVSAILISRIYNLLPIHIGVLYTLSTFYDRFQLLSHIYLLLAAGTGIHYLGRYLKRESGRQIMTTFLFSLLVLSLITIAARTPKKVFLDKTGQFETLDTAVIAPHVDELWNWIAANVRQDKERIYIEDTYFSFAWNDAGGPESKKTHVLALTSVFTEACQVGGWCGFTTRFAKQYEQGTAFGKLTDSPDFTESFVAGTLKALNCRYVVAHSPALLKRLLAMPFLEEVAQFGVFHVFAYPKMDPAWAYNMVSGEEARLIPHSQTHFEIIANGRKGDEIHIARAYHPNYTAEQSQNPVQVINSASLLRIKLPADGRQSIHFHYRFKKKAAIYGLLSGIFLMLIISALLPYAVRRR